MPIIADDYNAVDSASVAAVIKPDSDELWWLTVVIDGSAIQLRFVSLIARDDFYKSLVNAMGT